MSVYKGKVSGFVQRSEPRLNRAPVLVWDFRLERQNGGGNPLPRTAVEMRGTSFNGAINNGDIVEVIGTPNRHGVLIVRNVTNLSTASVVTETSSDVGLRVLRIFLILVFVAVFLAVAVTIVHVVLKEF